MKRTRARHYLTGETWEYELEGAQVVSLRIVDAPAESDLWVAPGLVDLQLNGQRGVDFHDPNIQLDDFRRLALDLDQDGVAWALATITTQSQERIASAITRWSQAKRVEPEIARRLPAMHLEGPYLSPHDGPRGAHPRDHIRPPDWEEFQRWQELADGGIILLTISPEWDTAPEFIRKAVASGVRISLGHLSATRDQIRAAVDAGATLSTHLGNGAHAQLDRHPNYLWHQLAEDRLTAMVIADGHHLPDEVLKCFVRCKGRDRIVAVSDRTGMGGMPAGRYDNTPLGAVEVLVDGRLVVAGQRRFLAGAALPLWAALSRLVRATDLTRGDAIAACSTQAAAAVGREHLLSSNPHRGTAIFLRWYEDGSVKLEQMLRDGHCSL